MNATQTQETDMPKIFLYGGSFYPPGVHHEAVARIIVSILDSEDRFIVIPCGPREDKMMVNDLSVNHRAALCDLAFGQIPGVEIDLTDLEHASFSRAWDLNQQFQKQFPNHEICHVIGADLIAGGAQGESEIQKKWFRGIEVWNSLHFVVQRREGVQWTKADLPPNSVVVDPTLSGSSTEIRDCIFRHEPFKHLVSEPVRAYIERHQLFTGRVTEGAAILREPFRPIVLADHSKPKAMALAAELEEAFPPNEGVRNCYVVIGGDGFMLRAIRSHWQSRLPFFGINAGTLGFLLNDLPFNNAVTRLTHCDYLKTYTQQLLFVDCTLPDGTHSQAIAFNDALVDRHTKQTAWLRVTIDDNVMFENMMSDGVLVATAAGSTGYARAMGGSPIMIGTSMIVLAGSNVCSHVWRSAGLPMQSEIQFDVLDPIKRPVDAVIDGIDFGSVTQMRVRVSRIASAELAFLPETDLAAKISRLQFPPSSRG